MRINDKLYRININENNCRELFLKELEYYRNNNQYPVYLFGKQVVNIYKNINIQIVVTYECNHNCQFCIENDANEIKTIPNQIYDSFTALITQYLVNNIMPTVSITGGEPTLYTKVVNQLINICEYYGIKKYNLNTNGLNLNEIRAKNLITNISRHHYNNNLAKEIFKHGNSNELNLAMKYNMQCVLLKKYINSVNEIKEYMNHYIKLGASGFSFRGLSILDYSKPYPDFVFDYNRRMYVNIFDILDKLQYDNQFEFIEQKIGDHYIYEIYKYRGFPVRFTYSDFALLREIEEKERNLGFVFSRANVIKPNGFIYTGWTYDLNELINDTNVHLIGD